MSKVFLHVTIDRKTNTIGILLEDIANPFSSALYRVYEDYAAEHGYMVFAGSLDEDPNREHELVNLFISRRVDGLLIAPSGKDHAYLKREVRNGVHFGFIDRPPINFSADVVLSTNRVGSREAVEHLIAFGHTKIAYLGDNPGIFTAQERYAGYVDALKKAKIPLNQSLVFKGFESEDQAVISLRNLMRAGNAPTAIFASQNLLTMAVLRALHAEGLEKKIAVVGFDDLPVAQLLSPGVTLVKQNLAEIGRLSIQSLLNRIDGDNSRYSTTVVATTLVPMGSGEIRPN